MPPFDLVELGDGAVQALIAEIRTLPPAAIPQLVQAFRLQFGLPAEAMVSDYIRTRSLSRIDQRLCSPQTPLNPPRSQ